MAEESDQGRWRGARLGHPWERPSVFWVRGQEHATWEGAGKAVWRIGDLTDLFPNLFCRFQPALCPRLLCQVPAAHACFMPGVHSKPPFLLFPGCGPCQAVPRSGPETLILPFAGGPAPSLSSCASALLSVLIDSVSAGLLPTHTGAPLGDAPGAPPHAFQACTEKFEHITCLLCLKPSWAPQCCCQKCRLHDLGQGFSTAASTTDIWG